MDEALLDNLDPEVVDKSEALESWRVVIQDLNYHPGLNRQSHIAPLSIQFQRFIARLKRRCGVFFRSGEAASRSIAKSQPLGP
jgi:hypothetical protein